MTGHDDFDRTLAGWLEAEAASPAPAGGLERVLAATRRRRPRPAWLAGPGSHWVGEAAPCVRAPALARPALGPALVDSAGPAARHCGPGRRGDHGRRASDPARTARLVARPPGLRPRRRHLRGRLGRQQPGPHRGRPPVLDGPSTVRHIWGEGSMWSPDGRYLAYRPTTVARLAPEPSTSAIRRATSRIVPGHRLASSRGRLTPPASRRGSTTRIANDRHLRARWPAPGADHPADRICPAGRLRPRVVARRPVAPDETRATGRHPRSGSCPSTAARHGVSLRRIPDRTGMSGTRLTALRWHSSTAIRSSLPRRMGPGVGSWPPGWSPRCNPPRCGRRQVIASRSAGRTRISRQADDTLPGTHELRVLDLASGTVTSLASDLGPDPLGPIAFSPEGDQILFSKSDGLWRVKTDGSDAQLLVSGTTWGDWQ